MGLIVLLGYLIFLLVGIWAIEWVFARAERRLRRDPDAWMQDQDGTYQSGERCACGNFLTPHEQASPDEDIWPEPICDDCLHGKGRN